MNGTYRQCIFWEWVYDLTDLDKRGYYGIRRHSYS